MPEISRETPLRSDATLVGNTVTQDLEQHPRYPAVRLQEQTGMGGLQRPLDLPRLIDDPLRRDRAEL
jgi:hypothetical protein